MIIWISVYAILLNKIRTVMIIKVSVLPKKKKVLTGKIDLIRLFWQFLTALV